MNCYLLCTYKLMRQDFMDQKFEYKHDALTGYIQVLIAHAYQWIVTSKTTFGKYFKSEVGCSPKQYLKEG